MINPTVISTISLNLNVLNEIANTVAEHILVCNYKEIAFLVNEVLESHNLPSIDERAFVKYLKGKEEKGLIPSPEWALLDKIITRETIRRKKELMETYLGTEDWKELKRVEFLFTNRFANFGKEEVETHGQVEAHGIIINIDARKMLITPVTSEQQMLDEGEDMIEKYLLKRGINE